MAENVSNNVGTIRFVGVEAPFYSNYQSIKPLFVEGHWSVIINTVLEKFKWNYEGKLEAFGESDYNLDIGVLVRNESDLAFQPKEQDHAEFRYIDYSPVAYETNTLMLSSDASATFKSSNFAFISIYSSWVWSAWVASFILFAVYSSLAENILARYYKHHRNDGLTGKFLIAYRVLLNQDTKSPPSRFGHSRLALLCWIIGCLILNAAFTGGLLSKLTLPLKPIYIDKLEDILKHPSLRIQIIKNTPIERNLKKSNHKVIRQIWEQIVRFDSAATYQEFDPDALSQGISGGEMISFETEDIVNGIWPSLFDCDFMRRLHASTKIGFKIQNAIPMRRNLDPAKSKLIKRTLQSLVEADIIWSSFQFEMWKNNECFAKDPDPPQKLKLKAIRVVSYGLVLGYLVSGIVLIIELKYYSRIQSQKKTTKIKRRSRDHLHK